MKTEHLAAFLVVYTGTACLLTLLFALLQKTSGRWLRAIVSLVLFALGVAVASEVMVGRNCVVRLGLDLIHLDRTQLATVASGVLGGLLAALALQGSVATRWARFWSQGIYVVFVGAFSLLVLKDLISPYILSKETTAEGPLIERTITPGFQLEEFAQLSIAPTSLALGPDHCIYVAGYAGVAYQNGVIVRLQPSPSGPQEERVADYVNRPHGIAFWGKDLYVSHAGQYNRANKGRIVQENTGAVTRIRDLAGEGKFTHHDDVIKGLPGAQLPDGLHQNNGITFDSEGNLYVGVGVASDRSPLTHDYAGTILRASPDGAVVEVFARGLRNPFGLVIGRDGELFCTDNDDNTTNPGDPLFHVRKDGHHGHPYNAVGKDVQITGIIKPLLRSKSALEGLAYAPPGSLPAGYDDCLYVASYRDGHINRVRLQRTKDGTYTAEMDLFAHIPSALGVIVSPKEKAIYACSHDQRKIYRITPK